MSGWLRNTMTGLVVLMLAGAPPLVSPCDALCLESLSVSLFRLSTAAHLGCLDTQAFAGAFVVAGRTATPALSVTDRPNRALVVGPQPDPWSARSAPRAALPHPSGSGPSVLRI